MMKIDICPLPENELLIFTDLGSMLNLQASEKLDVSFKAHALLDSCVVIYNYPSGKSPVCVSYEPLCHRINLTIALFLYNISSPWYMCLAMGSKEGVHLFLL